MASNSSYTDDFTTPSRPFHTGPARQHEPNNTRTGPTDRTQRGSRAPHHDSSSGKSSQSDRRQTSIGSSDSRHSPTYSPGPPMLKKQIPNVFPLHLAPIDHFFLEDDTPHYPMTSIIHLDFTGAIQRPAFETALDTALQRHALLRSHIKPAKQNRPCWVKASTDLPWMDWGPIDKPLELPTQEQIDLSESTGLRFWIRGDQETTRVTLQVHHACTDGTGVYRFLGDLLAAYAAQTSDDPAAEPQFAEINPVLLRDRRRKMADEGHQVLSIPTYVFHSLKKAFDIFGKSIRALAPPTGRERSETSHETFPSVHSVELDKAQHKKLRAIAGNYGGTLNDLLMTEMFRTIVRWNDTHGKSTGNPWLRIMMPFDLREQSDYHMPAANMTSYTFVTRRKSQCVDLKGLMTSVRDETLALKHQRAGTQFIDAIMAAAHAPYILTYLLRRKSCIATTCLSNIGDPSKRFTAELPRSKGRIVAGNLTLENVTGVPPLRHHTHATLAVFSYLRKLTISVRCDPFLFNAQDSIAFVSMFRNGLLSHIADDASDA